MAALRVVGRLVDGRERSTKTVAMIESEVGVPPAELIDLIEDAGKNDEARYEHSISFRSLHAVAAYVVQKPDAGPGRHVCRPASQHDRIPPTGDAVYLRRGGSMGEGGSNLTYEATMSGASLNSVLACWIDLTASERAAGTLRCLRLALGLQQPGQRRCEIARTPPCLVQLFRLIGGSESGRVRLTPI